MTEPNTLWTVIICLGLGSYFLRFAFLGIVGDRPMPKWLLRHLRYTAVAMLPAMVSPLVVWPAATGGQPDLPRMLAASATLLVGLATKNVLAAIISGAATLFGALYLLG
ncbi:AzlD domain-containing protein [uncultured Roseobacter sp.]|uniref:AzlD domain-containing protein n=1 Tax=uncultured Roseobacter sp. TaxID=114847 RepID=UPI0026329AE8|nr:AzlD domain-containing protein [uncultured Roseobacter sp.]